MKRCGRMPFRKFIPTAGALVLGLYIAATSTPITGAQAPSTAPGGANARLLRCMYGSIGLQPVHPPPGYELQFAEATVEISSPKAIPNAVVSRFDLVDQAGNVIHMKRVIYVRLVDEPAAEWNAGPSWNGTLPAGVVRLHVRVALTRQDNPQANPGRCTLTIGPYAIDGPVDGAWGT